MGSADDRNFRVNFSGEGVNKLRETVRDKLKEFMGDYTDDTLVEYVIVLLRNGRGKEEARTELNVFLGDGSHSFVSWLWEHLSSNLNQYVQHQEVRSVEAAHVKPMLGKSTSTNDATLLDAERESGNVNELSRNRRNREWRGLINDADRPPLVKSDHENNHFEESADPRVTHVRRPSALEHSDHRRRSQPDERQYVKREAVSHSNISASRRLLQFAVRDAVGTSRPSVNNTEPSLKRLRSVVSTPVEDIASTELPKRIRSVAKVVNPMSTVIKAVAEAAEDVTTVRYAGSVFDRIGRGINISGADHVTNYTDGGPEEDEFDDFDQIHMETEPVHRLRSDYCKQDSDITVMQREARLTTSDFGGRIVDIPHNSVSDLSGAQESIFPRHIVTKNNDEMQIVRKHQDRVRASNASHKILDVSANVYTKQTEVAYMDNQNSSQVGEIASGRSDIQLMKENNNFLTVGNVNGKSAQDNCKEFQKDQPPVPPGLSTAGGLLGDADTRTIFISNVHFAATKDSVSRHFNRFGEVLKVVIATDSATGKPKGSAYVEFMNKEAADNALSLDGTSFMSRILKVVKSSAYQEDTSTITLPRVARGSPFSFTRFPRAAYSRGIPMSATYRPHLQIKPGARSLQWKRDSQASPAENSPFGSANNFSSPIGRSLTYIRTESKTDANVGTI